MKSLPLQDFLTLYPSLDPTAIKALYGQAFRPELIMVYFAGWQFYPSCSRYFDTSEQVNVIWFEACFYHLNEQVLSPPVSLSDFIDHCLSHQIVLYWREQVVDGLFANLKGAVKLTTLFLTMYHPKNVDRNEKVMHSIPNQDNYSCSTVKFHGKRDYVHGFLIY